VNFVYCILEHRLLILCTALWSKACQFCVLRSGAQIVNFVYCIAEHRLLILCTAVWSTDC
jgi:hypothetical protein